MTPEDRRAILVLAFRDFAESFGLTPLEAVDIACEAFATVDEREILDELRRAKEAKGGGAS